MDNLHVSHRAHPDIAPEQTRDARARAWMYVFEVWNSKKAVEPAHEPDGPSDENLTRNERRPI